MSRPARLRLAYGSNGMTDHRLDDALGLLADLGYDGVALTLDHGHLDPYAPGLAARVGCLSSRLQALGLAVVIETGGRFLLDPARKHEPSLISGEGSERRVDLLRRAIAIGADLGAEAVSLWSGATPGGLDLERAWQRLVEGMTAVVGAAERAGMALGFEPEPGMLVDRIEGFLRLHCLLGEPSRLGITLDLGHCVCLEPDPVGDCIRRSASVLVHVQADDMRRGVHEHLEFGEGELDLPGALGALREVGYSGLVAVELPRHSHIAHLAVPRAIERLRAAEAPPKGCQARRAPPGAPTPRLGTGIVLAPLAAPTLAGTVRDRLDPHSWRRLAGLARQVATGTAQLGEAFSAALGAPLDREPLAPGAPPGSLWAGWTLADAARTILLGSAGSRAPAAVAALYSSGDTEERVSCLRALDVVECGPDGIPLVEEALRAADPRLVEAALGRYAIANLADGALAQAVLKWVFLDLPLERAPGIERRVTPQLVEMLVAYAHERVVAGRAVPDQLWRLLDGRPAGVALVGLADLAGELDHPDPGRRRATWAALRGLAGASPAPCGPQQRDGLPPGLWPSLVRSAVPGAAVPGAAVPGAARPVRPAGSRRLFEPHAHMTSRTTDDYEAMAGAGVLACVEPAFWQGQPRRRPESFADYFDALLGWEPFRSAQFGIAHHCALALNPKEANDPGLRREVVALLGSYLGKRGVVAVGEVGYDSMTPAEDEAFEVQLDLALAHELPVLVHTPHRDKLAGTRRTLAVIAGSGVPAERVLIDHNNELTVSDVVASGCWVGFSIYPDTKMDVARMVRILEDFGTERMVVNSAADWGRSDPLAIARVAEAMAAASFEDQEIDRVVWRNPVEFYSQSGRLRVGAQIGGPLPVDRGDGTFMGNSVLRGEPLDRPVP